jgi:hypothetical protein
VEARRRDDKCDAILTSFATYCRETSLHGWKYVAPVSRSSGGCEKMSWLSLLIVALVTASVFVFRASQVEDYLQHKTG